MSKDINEQITAIIQRNADVIVARGKLRVKFTSLIDNPYGHEATETLRQFNRLSDYLDRSVDKLKALRDEGGL